MSKKTKKNSLRAFWSKKEKDIMFGWPDGLQTKTDGHFLYHRFSIGPFNYDGNLQLSFLEELDKRGYDLTTLSFSIRKKETPSPLKETRDCEYCGKQTRITTAGCDHCDVEDK